MDVASRGTIIDHAERDGPKAASTSMSSVIEQLAGFARRQHQVLIIGAVVPILLGLLYLLVTPVQYTATATLLIDSSPLRVLQSQSQPFGDVPLDTLQVGSQVEILGSEKIALAVIRKLKLAEDPEFVKAGEGLLSTSNDANSMADKERQALVEFVSRRNIWRIERTYALSISFTSRSPVTAAKIANAIVDAYIDYQLEAKDQTRRRAGVWLQDRINELRSQVTSADRAVLEFKEKNNIVDLGGENAAAGTGASGRLIGEQQLFELNSQLGTARAATNEAKARLERIEQVRKIDAGEAAVADTLRNEVITRLRNQYLDLSAREANLSARYGPDHLAAVNLRSQMEDVRRNIGAELERMAASYRSDYEIAKTRQENLERALASLVSEGQVTNRDRLGLTELASSAKIYHAIYDHFLQRYMDAIQEESFPISDAHVLSSAAPPSQKSKPNSSLILAIAATMGIIISLAIAGLREAIDGVFRTGRQAEQALQIRCLSVIPLLEPPAVPTPAAGRLITRRTQPHADAWRGPEDRTNENMPLDTTSSVTFSDPLLRYVVDNPFSVFAEAFRAIKVTAAMRDNKVIGITSTVPDEGKSTVACNLATLMSDAGKRVILMDADLRNPTLARSLNPKPTVGLMELLAGKIDLQQAIGQDRATGLAFLPLVLNEQLVHSDEILSSQGFRALMDQLRQRYDYVIMDLPPIAPVVDVRAALPVIDSLVLVVQWGSTRIRAVQHHLMAEPELLDRLMGLVLNKADLKALERFEQHGLYHNGYYENRGYRQQPVQGR